MLGTRETGNTETCWCAAGRGSSRPQSPPVRSAVTSLVPLQREVGLGPLGQECRSWKPDEPLAAIGHPAAKSHLSVDVGILPGVSLTRADYLVVNPESRLPGSWSARRGSHENGVADMELGSADEAAEAAIGSRPDGVRARGRGGLRGGTTPAPGRHSRTGRGLARRCELALPMTNNSPVQCRTWRGRIR